MRAMYASTVSAAEISPRLMRAATSTAGRARKSSAGLELVAASVARLVPMSPTSMRPRLRGRRAAVHGPDGVFFRVGCSQTGGSLKMVTASEGAPRSDQLRPDYLSALERTTRLSVARRVDGLVPGAHRNEARDPLGARLGPLRRLHAIEDRVSVCRVERIEEGAGPRVARQRRRQVRGHGRGAGAVVSARPAAIVPSALDLGQTRRLHRLAGDL